MKTRTTGYLDTVRRIILTLPGVEEGPCYGTPGFRVRGKFLARMKEDGLIPAYDQPDKTRTA